MARVLSDAELSFYETEGYLLVRGSVSSRTLELAEQILDRWSDGVMQEWKASGLVDDDHGGLPFQSRMLHAWRAAGRPKYLRSPRRDLVSRELYEMLTAPELLDIAGDLLGTDEVSVHEIFNGRARLPDQKWTSTPWHQDAQYFKAAEHLHVPTFWFPLQDVDETSSCLEVQPRFHENDLQEDYDDPETGFLGLTPELSSTFSGVPIRMRRGDVLCFTQRTPHRALPNEREMVRWSIDARYEATDSATGAELGIVARSGDPSRITPVDTWLSRWNDRASGTY
jgi:hypothetical protein